MDAFLVAHEHYKAVEARGDSSVRRRAELECLYQESERFFCALATVAYDFKDAFLQRRVVDTH